jgi:hypothetical protein
VDWLEWQQLRADAAKWGAETGHSADQMLSMLRYYAAMPEPEQRALLAHFYTTLTPEERAACDRFFADICRILRRHPTGEMTRREHHGR